MGRAGPVRRLLRGHGQGVLRRGQTSTWTILPGGPNVSVIQQLGAGAATFGIDSALALFQARDTGVPVILVAQTDQRDGFIKVAFTDAGITRYEPTSRQGRRQLPRRVGVRRADRERGLEPGDFTLVQQGFTMDPFINGELDVASATLWNEYNVLIEGSALPARGPRPLDYDDYEFAIPHDAIVTLEATVADNRDAAVAFLCALLQRLARRLCQPVRGDRHRDELGAGRAPSNRRASTRSRCSRPCVAAAAGRIPGLRLRLDRTRSSTRRARRSPRYVPLDARAGRPRVRLRPDLWEEARQPEL